MTVTVNNPPFRRKLTPHDVTKAAADLRRWGLDGMAYSTAIDSLTHHQWSSQDPERDSAYLQLKKPQTYDSTLSLFAASLVAHDLTYPQPFVLLCQQQPHFMQMRVRKLASTAKLERDGKSKRFDATPIKTGHLPSARGRGMPTPDSSQKLKDGATTSQTAESHRSDSHTISGGWPTWHHYSGDKTKVQTKITDAKLASSQTQGVPHPSHPVQDLTSITNTTKITIPSNPKEPCKNSQIEEPSEKKGQPTSDKSAGSPTPCLNSLSTTVTVTTNPGSRNESGTNNQIQTPPMRQEQPTRLKSGGAPKPCLVSPGITSTVSPVSLDKFGTTRQVQTPPVKQVYSSSSQPGGAPKHCRSSLQVGTLIDTSPGTSDKSGTHSNDQMPRKGYASAYRGEGVPAQNSVTTPNITSTANPLMPSTHSSIRPLVRESLSSLQARVNLELGQKSPTKQVKFAAAGTSSSVPDTVKQGHPSISGSTPQLGIQKALAKVNEFVQYSLALEKERDEAVGQHDALKKVIQQRDALQEANDELIRQREVLQEKHEEQSRQSNTARVQVTTLAVQLRDAEDRAAKLGELKAVLERLKKEYGEIKKVRE